ncbi:Uncharacterised protein [Brevundimonas vancanneytii]|uniref:Uncharacterized protein n=1 Tax=Brevundimonas vancanneytii TaxID=1325724 RepID=A0A4P1KB61_9CAUL|nr:Uncharacterised protein [Brevundimonas vancanneytii]
MAAGLRLDLGEESVPGGVIGQGVDVDPRAPVHRFDRQGRARRDIDRSAIGRFQVLGRGRLRRQGEVAGAAADLELAGARHTGGHRIVAVPQQIGRAADAAGLGRQVALELVQLGLGQVFDRLGVAALEHGAQRRRAAHARLNIGDDVLTVAPGRGHARPAGGEERTQALIGRAGGDVGIAETVGVPAQQIGVAVAAVDLTGLGLRLLQARIQPGAEGGAGVSRHHGGRVVVTQSRVHGLKVLPRQIAEVLGRGGRGGEAQGQYGRRSGKQALHRGSPSPFSMRVGRVLDPLTAPSPPL